MSEPDIEKMKANKDVEGLIRALKDEDYWVRWRAAESLGRIGDKRAVEPLIEILNDTNYMVQTEVAWALRQIREPAVKPLIKALKDEVSDVRMRAAEALGKIAWQPKDDIEKAYYLIAKKQWEELVKLGKPAVEPLIEALKDKDKYVRSKVAEALGNIGDRRAVEPLIEALIDKDEDVRRSAVVAHRYIGYGRAVKPIIKSLKDEYKYYRKVVKVTLEKIKTKEKISAFSILKIRTCNWNWRRRIRWRIISGLIISTLISVVAFWFLQSTLLIHEPFFIVIIIMLLSIPFILVITSLFIIARLTSAQSHVEDKKWYSELGNRLYEINRARLIASNAPKLITSHEYEVENIIVEKDEALKRVDKKQIKQWIGALKDKDSDIRRKAAEALGKIGDRRAVEPLIEALKDENWEIRSGAAEALRDIRDRRAVEPLIEALKDGDSDVRKAAKAALEKIP